MNNSTVSSAKEKAGQKTYSIGKWQGRAGKQVDLFSSGEKYLLKGGKRRRGSGGGGSNFRGGSTIVFAG